jgi:hypothetical protein
VRAPDRRNCRLRVTLSFGKAGIELSIIDNM